MAGNKEQTSLIDLKEKPLLKNKEHKEIPGF